MKFGNKKLAMAAAFAGLVGGSAVRAAQPSHAAGLSSGLASAGASFSKKKAIEKHGCKGMNSCKGNGGGTKKEWGKNECKGKGACATDGSKPKM